MEAGGNTGTEDPAQTQARTGSNSSIIQGIEPTLQKTDVIRKVGPVSRTPSMGRSTSLKYIGEPTLTIRPGTQKTAEEEKIITESLRLNNNLKRFVNLEEEHIKRLVETATRETIVKGKKIMVEGSLNNAVFFTVIAGSFEISSSFVFEITTKDEGNGEMSFLSRPAAEFSDEGLNDEVVLSDRQRSTGEKVQDTTQQDDNDDKKTVRKHGKNFIWRLVDVVWHTSMGHLHSIGRFCGFCDHPGEL